MLPILANNLTRTLLIRDDAWSLSNLLIFLHNYSDCPEATRKDNGV